MVLDLVATGSNTIIRGYGLTGSDLVVWGGCDASIGQCDDIGEGILNDGVGYDPARDRWRELAGSPLATGVHPQAVWTGNEMLVYAGTASPEAGPTVAAYNSATDSWRALTLHLLLDAMPRQVGQGQYFVLWGGSTLGDEVEFGNGAAYHPETGQWFALPPAPEGAERDRHAMVWIHGQLYISGGFQTTGPLVFKPELTG